MQISLSEHFTYRKLFRFVFPSIVMMIFTSIYGVVDGLFVSNFVGKTPFAAINLIMPLLIIIGAFGFMIGTGGTAIVAKTLGEGNREKANKYFSFLIYVTVIGGTAAAIIGYIFLRPISVFLGAEGEMLDCCVRYGRIVILAMPFFMLQNVFQSFFVTAEKPKLGLLVVVIAGVTNMVLDALLVAVIPLGLEGAAIATSISQTVGGVIPIIYFAKQNSSTLRLTKASFYGSVLFKTCTNGSSELMSNISSSIVTILYNYQLMRFAGEDGVAAYGVIMYVCFIFVAIFIGYAIGSAPIVSYNFGADNRYEIKNLFRKSIIFNSLCGFAMFGMCFLLAGQASSIFVGYDKALQELTVRGFKIFAFSFIFTGVNIYGSALFTALNNGVISAVISFFRTFVFQCAGVLLLPELFSSGIDGVWFSIVVSELASLALTIFLIIKKRKKYGYI